VIRAKHQIGLLTPISQDSNRLSDQETERTAYLLARDWLPAWFANLRLELIEAGLSKLQTSLAGARHREQRASRELNACTLELERIRDQIRESGGGALEALREQIVRLESDLQRAMSKRRDYDLLCKNLGLEAPIDAEAFGKSLERISQLKDDEQDRHNQLSEQRQVLAVELARTREELGRLDDELTSLKSRRSAIPLQQIQVRDQLCQALGLAEEELPFAGELLEVRQEDAVWEGAIERLLHNFALSLLVPAEHYGRVMEWVDATNLKARLVYYRVPQDVDKPGRKADGATVAGKLIIRPRSDLYAWLNAEVNTRFGHVCATTPEQFRREPNAVTAQGQVKSGGRRHEKDDRHSLADRTRYVLGFSNLRKIEALEVSLRKLVAQESAAVENEGILSDKQTDAQTRRELLAQLQTTSDYADIDVQNPKAELEQLRKRMAALESGNDVLAELMRTRDSLQQQRDKLEDRRDDSLRDVQRIEVNIELQESDRKNTLEQLSDAFLKPGAEEAFVLHGVFLQGNAPQALAGAKITLGTAADLERRYSKWLNEKIAALDKRIARLGERIIRQMGIFKHAYPEETRELDDSLESVAEYNERLATLTRDDLPRFEKRFKEKLNTDVINDISLFNSKLSRTQALIRDRIAAINGSMHKIDYNPGRFIRLELEETYDSEIRDFRAQLRACTEGALAGASNEDERYAENKFLEVRRIIERFKERPSEPERDRLWTRKVTDVRNWYLFAASERWRETDEEYEHYTDSGGKSGGQKEKLAYMILAASLVYNYGSGQDGEPTHGFRFVIIDEAFLKSSDEAARFGLELFKTLDLQLLIVTPLLKVNTIAPYIAHLGFVSHDDITHRSALRNITIDEFERDRHLRGAAANGDKDAISALRSVDRLSGAAAGVGADIGVDINADREIGSDVSVD
jgi:uncharacterized protein YPO0396